jgi:hypothetical protein
LLAFERGGMSLFGMPFIPVLDNVLVVLGVGGQRRAGGLKMSRLPKIVAEQQRCGRMDIRFWRKERFSKGLAATGRSYKSTRRPRQLVTVSAGQSHSAFHQRESAVCCLETTAQLRKRLLYSAAGSIFLRRPASSSYSFLSVSSCLRRGSSTQKVFCSPSLNGDL